MCCGQGHYPKDAGIWRTDATGAHVHYSDTVVDPPDSCPGYSSEHHWHAVTPGRITACVTYQDLDVGLKVMDWQRIDREVSMGLPSKGFDMVASIKFANKTAAERGRELVLLAIAEGYDWTQEELQRLLPNAKIAHSGHRQVYRPMPPTYEQWLRWNTFDRSAQNDHIYQAEFGPGLKHSGLNGEISIVDGDFDLDAWHKASADQAVELNKQILEFQERVQVARADPTASGWKPIQPTEEQTQAAAQALLKSLGLG